MANEIFNGGGARVTGILGGDFTSKLQTYIVPATDSVALYIGDFVKFVGTSLQDDNGSWFSRTQRAEAGALIVGVIAGFEATSAYLDTTARAASTERKVYVHEFPYVEIEIQADASVGATEAGGNADIKYYPGVTGGAFNTSGCALDVTTIDNAADLQLRIMGFAAGSTPSDNYPVLRCLINEHFYKQTAGGS